MDSGEFLDVLKLGVTNPETAVEFFGVIAAEAFGAKGAGLVTKAGKLKSAVSAIEKMDNLTDAAKATKIAALTEAAGISTMNKLTYAAATQSPVVALSFSQAKVQEEDFKKREGRRYTADELLGATLVGTIRFKLESS